LAGRAEAPLLIQTYHWALETIQTPIDLQHIFHASNKLAVLLRLNDPTGPSMRTSTRFFRIRMTVPMAYNRNVLSDHAE